MSIKTVVIKIINKYLGEFLQNISANQLNLHIFKGEQTQEQKGIRC